MASHATEKGQEYPSNSKYPAIYPPNPEAPPGYSPYPTASAPYPSNLPVLQTNSANPLPTYISAAPGYYYGNQPQTRTIVTTQVGIIVVPQPAQKDYLAWSITNLICCNLILGIVAVIFSSMTRDAVRLGHSSSAATYSRTALGLNIAALVLGIIGHIIWIACLIGLSLGSFSYSSSYNYYG